MQHKITRRLALVASTGATLGYIAPTITPLGIPAALAVSGVPTSEPTPPGTLPPPSTRSVPPTSTTPTVPPSATLPSTATATTPTPEGTRTPSPSDTPVPPTDTPVATAPPTGTTTTVSPTNTPVPPSNENDNENDNTTTSISSDTSSRSRGEGGTASSEASLEGSGTTAFQESSPLIREGRGATLAQPEESTLPFESTSPSVAVPGRESTIDASPIRPVNVSIRPGAPPQGQRWPDSLPFAGEAGKGLLGIAGGLGLVSAGVAVWLRKRRGVR